MAGKASTLETIIAINAKVGNGFTQVGSTLTEMGNIVNGLSQQLINFGKESTGVYRSYEKAMADAEVALATKYGRDTEELAKVMKNLDAAATAWAASSIFHTNDVASAIVNAAHAGWDYEEIMSGLPAAMELAQAGSIDLATAVDYVTKITHGAGIEFGDIGDFIDKWIFSANSSASSVDEFGQAMIRMGSTMQWAANPEELLVLLAATANAGAVGSEAGTLIRNSIMRLVAPTAKAEKQLNSLGASALEVSEIMSDEDLAAAYEELAANGFQGVFDKNGNMRSILDIYSDLAVVLGSMAGGIENIGKNEKTMKILGAIFPTKTVTEAMNLINAAAAGWDGLYDAMINGEATGYGEYAATTMMDTLDGKIETFESKLERLKQLVGEELAPKLESAMDFMGGIVDNLANMDEDKFGALVAGLTAIAGLGPALITAGGAMKMIGLLFTPTGAMTLAVTGLVAATAAIREMQESDFANQFGDMEFDKSGIMDYIDSIGKEFTDAYTEVNKYKDALNGSVEAYKTASSTFSAKIFEDMITGATLTEDDKKQLQKLGTEMYLQVKSAIANSTAGSLSYWEMLFEGDEQNPTYLALKGATTSAYDEMIAEAEGISRDMREALTSAFNDDGSINEEEYNKFLNYMRQYNALMARAAAEAQQEEYEIGMDVLLHKAQTASIDGINALAAEAAAKRDAQLKAEEENYLYERARAARNGASEEDLQAADEAYYARVAAEQARYSDFFLKLYDSQAQQSGLGESYLWLESWAEKFQNGEVSADDLERIITDQLGISAYAGQRGWGEYDSQRAQLGKLLGFAIKNLGGEKAVEEQIAYYEKNGQAEMAKRLRNLYTAEQLVNGWNTVTKAGGADDPFNWLTGSFQTTGSLERDASGDEVQKVRAQDFLTQNALFTPETVEQISAVTENATAFEEGINDLMKVVGGIISGTEGFDTLTNTWYGLAREQQENIAKMLLSGVGEKYDLDKIANNIGYGDNGYAKLFGLYDLLYGEASKHPEDYLLSNVKLTAEDILPEEPLTTTVEVDGDTSKLQEKISSASGQNVVVNLTPVWTGGSIGGSGRLMFTNKLYAEGGRADEPSIFGEDGAEWAIPEEHSDRTARLLDAARAASGFTWAEILSRYGGMNANASNTPTTLVYSPTINATDATGVEQVLREDKRRFEKWLAEKQMRDSVEVYA